MTEQIALLIGSRRLVLDMDDIEDIVECVEAGTLESDSSEASARLSRRCTALHKRLEAFLRLAVP
jgi:hypothetical protein